MCRSQIVQVCFIGKHVPWQWFAASIALSSTLGISPNAIPPQSPYALLFLPQPPPPRPQCVMFPSLCSCVLIVQHRLMSENMRCLDICSFVSLLRMMVSSFMHFPAKDMNSIFFMTQQYSMLYMCYIFFIQSIIDGHLG